MWRMSSGDRVLSATEWELFRFGLADVGRGIIGDNWNGCDDVADMEEGVTGFGAFDSLTRKRQVCLLFEVVSGLRDPDVAIPELKACNESVIGAAVNSLHAGVMAEIAWGESVVLRSLLLLDFYETVFAEGGKLDGYEPPTVGSCEEDKWRDLVEAFADDILWDRDYEMWSAEKSKLGGYFADEAPEPSDQEFLEALKGLVDIWSVAEQGLFGDDEDAEHG